MNNTYSEEEIERLPFMDKNLDLEKRVEDLLGRLTIEEKFKLSSGRFMWQTKPIKRLGVKPFIMYDGPHGVRPDTMREIKSTYFPSAICRAATWNPKLSYDFGKAVAEEVREVGAHMLLAPGINIHRTPMNGRTFEYQTEDPYLNKVLAVATVKGIQSQRIAACVKHFICNNQETNRLTVSSEVSERALQEMYLPAFKATVLEADAWSFMTCYNKVNGIYGSENINLLRERLMGEWGFRGFTVSDWNATAFTNTAGCVKAGLSLEMPTAKKYNKSKMIKAFREGQFGVDNLNDNIRRLIRVMLLVGLYDDEKAIPKGSRNTPEHQAIARKIAEEGIVLLKNENASLPLNINKIKKIAVLGPNKNYKLVGDDFLSGGGSSVNFPPYEISPLEGLKEKCLNRVEVTNVPSEADATIIFAGLNHDSGKDAEGEDKNSFELPSEQIELIQKTSKECSNTIIVLINGSPIAMNSWIDSVSSVVEAWYGGMEAGKAIASVIFGDTNPSGKLTITFPKRLSDSPAHVSKRTFPGDDKVYYDEGIFVGYRHFDARDIAPLFPFGFGLSYTTFSYENLMIDKNKIRSDDEIKVSVDVTNSGSVEGKEIVQLYVQDVESSVERPIKELKRFEKVFLHPNETKTVLFELKKEDLSFYNETVNSWIVENGTFKILVGSSSRDIQLQGEIEYIG
ncbi:MAG: glycoside hydrolase family 3 C-terminal domain-containing protein [Candidatus Lokiarchaeota archaeon]|nr:glycoside hydrolase family 3 C-terminal domain-containing protein [Candidatus Lokiarchaeota archaeon]